MANQKVGQTSFFGAFAAVRPSASDAMSSLSSNLLLHREEFHQPLVVQS